MIIPHTALQASTLEVLISDFATRDGTDYGDHEMSLDEKIHQIKKLLDEGKLVISFDPDTESCALQRPT